MATIAEYLTALDTWRDQLAANLNTMGVAASTAEKLNTLVPKVLQITGGGGSKIKLFENGSAALANYGLSISAVGTAGVQVLDEFLLLYPTFCDTDTDYSLNYSYTAFGWDYTVYTMSSIPFNVTSSTQIAISYQSGSTESGSLYLVPTSGRGETQPANTYIYGCVVDGTAIEVPFSWLYSETPITTLTSLSGVTPDEYYLAWIGKSNNSHPVIKSITVIS